MTLCVASSDLGDSVPSGNLVPSVVASPFVMYQYAVQIANKNEAFLPNVSNVNVSFYSTVMNLKRNDALHSSHELCNFSP